jgi:putative chitinase
MTPEVFSKATGVPLSRAQKWADPVSAALALYGISEPLEVAHWLAQVGHESGGFVYTKELWGPTAQQSRYEGRKDLGNVQPGDGKRYMGRGLLQTTGRSNYTTAAAKLGIDCVNHPELLEEPTYAALSACQFWLDNKCGTLALADDILRLTKRINGGTNGLEDRQARTKVSKSILIGK